MNIKQIRTQIKRLEAAEAEGVIHSEATEKKLAGLRLALAQHENGTGRVKNFRRLAIGTETEWGVIAKCPACGQHGACRQLRFWTAGKAVSFVHSVEAVPTIFELRRVGKQLTDDGMIGQRYRLTGDRHLIVDGQPVMKETKPKADAPALGTKNKIAAKRTKAVTTALPIAA